ncbi:MAG: hypothetical protein ACYDDO_03170 [Acidiferrobacterales bacterium]
MSREQWNVDEELSRLKEEIKEKQGEPPNPERRESMDDSLQQHIQGNHNVQVAGDFTVHARRAVDPNHPQAIRCPQCQGLAYQRSDWCADCNFNLRDYRIERAKKEKRRRLTNMMLFCSIPRLFIIFAGTRYFAGIKALYFLGVGGSLLAVAVLAAVRIGQIGFEK